MNDWIGFFVSMAILLYLMLRSRPAKESPEQEDTLKEFLEGLNEDMRAKKKPAPPLHKPKKHPQVVTPQKKPEIKVVRASYEVIGKAESSRVERLLQSFHDKRDMVILHEIIGPPKCKRR